MPSLRLPPEQMAALRAQYEGGAAIRDLVAQWGYSYGVTRNLLLEAGATLRRRGGYHREARERLRASRAT